MTRIHLAVSSVDSLRAIDAFRVNGASLSALVSFAMAGCVDHVVGYGFERTILDSGAFSVRNSGASISLDALCDEIRAGRLDEYIALDVIGDAEASLVNVRKMSDRGLDVIPVFHVGDPWRHLDEYCERFVKVALAPLPHPSFNARLAWIRQCFARHWPHRFHGLGVADPRIVYEVPFESVDSASWSLKPGRFTNYGATDKRIPQAKRHDLMANYIRHFLVMQDRLRSRWRRDLSLVQGV